MIALGGPTLKLREDCSHRNARGVSMIALALGGPTLKLLPYSLLSGLCCVSMIALGGPTLKPRRCDCPEKRLRGLNDSTGRA